MAIDPSMEPMLEVFIYESTSLLEQLDEILLDAEKSKSFSEDNINEIFRTMHTIKGSSAMMEFTGISTLAHAVEDVFFILREDPSRMGNVNEALFDLVFQASDFLKTEIESVQNSGEANKDPSAMIAELKRLAAIMKGEAPAGGAPAPAAAAESAAPLPANSDPEMVRIRVHFEDGCQMENIRAFMLISQLKELCDKLESIPANPESDSSCCSEIIKNGLLLCLKPAGSLDDVIQSIENAVNIKTYEVIEDTPQSAPAQEAQAAPAGSGEPSPAKPAAAPA